MNILLVLLLLLVGGCAHVNFPGFSQPGDMPPVPYYQEHEKCMILGQDNVWRRC